MTRASLCLPVFTLLLSGCPDAPAGDETGESGETGTESCEPVGLYEGPWLRATHNGSCGPYTVSGEGADFGDDFATVRVDGVNLSGNFDVASCSGLYTGEGRTLTVERDHDVFSAQLSVQADGCTSTFEAKFVPERELRPFPESGPVGLEGPLSGYLSGWRPQIHMGAEGNAVVIYNELGEENLFEWNLVGRTYDKATQTFSTSHELDDSDEPLEFGDAGLAGAPSGAAAMAWVQMDASGIAGGNRSMFGNVYIPGVGFEGASPLELVHDEVPDHHGGAPVVAAAEVDGEFRAAVFYGLGGNRVMTRYERGWWAPEPVLTPADDGHLVGAAMNEAGDLALLILQIEGSSVETSQFGDFYVNLFKLTLWTRAANQVEWTSHLVYQSPSIDGSQVGPEGEVPAIDEEPTLTQLSDGRLLIVLEQSDWPSEQLSSQIRPFIWDGSALTAMTIPVLENDIEGSHVGVDHRVAADGAGGAVITWSYDSFVNGSVEQQVFSHFDGEAFSPPRVYGREFPAEGQALVGSPDGHMLLVGGRGDEFDDDPPGNDFSVVATLDPSTRTFERAVPVQLDRWGQEFAAALDASGEGLLIQRTVQTDNENLFHLWPSTIPAEAPSVSSGAPCRDADFDDACDTCDPCVDRDGDGHGDGCALGGDCDDANPMVFEGAPDLPGDGLDQDCQGGDPVFDDAIGIFVSAGSPDTNPGTQAAPVGTIAQGISLAEAAGLTRVFVSAGHYPEDVDATLEVYGGFDPLTWTRDIEANPTRIHVGRTQGALAAIDGFEVDYYLWAQAGGGQLGFFANCRTGTVTPSGISGVLGGVLVAVNLDLTSSDCAFAGEGENYLVGGLYRSSEGLCPYAGSRLTVTNARFEVSGGIGDNVSLAEVDGDLTLVGNVFHVLPAEHQEIRALRCNAGGHLTAVNNTFMGGPSLRRHRWVNTSGCSVALMNNLVINGDTPVGGDLLRTDGGRVHVWNNLFDGDPSHCLVEPQGDGRCRPTLYELQSCAFEDCASAGQNLSAAPGVADLAGGDHHLLEGSAALDAGMDPTPLCVELGADMDGDARGASFDIGADERP